MSRIRLIFATAAIFMTAFMLRAINPEDSVKFINWQNLDPKNNKSWGISTDRAYEELLKGKTSKTVIVAVIDGGVDINHVDLKDHIWINEDEIPANGIDDDNNGYIDDVNGWNFLGNSTGENIDQAPLEVTRLYGKYQKIFGELSDDSAKAELAGGYEMYKKVTETFDEKLSEATQQKMGFDNYVFRFNRYDSILKKALIKEEYTESDLKSLKVAKKSAEDTAKRFMLKSQKRGLNKAKLAEYSKYFESRINFHYNTSFCSRTIIGDNSEEWSDTAYGNNNVAGPRPDHGTMVSGIIAADRYNNIGIKGVADNVKIMVIRTVPDGDEWDKDVAKSIEYALNNGAEIINMSFGKAFSPQKEFIDSIVKMVDEHNVLLVHAAGNDSENNDVELNFPSKYGKNDTLLTKTWLTIGSTAKNKKKKEFVSEYSNYGKKSVDMFAPGENIITCSPGSKYDMASGTSFSAPMVSGAAALLKSYYPKLTALQLKEIILKSGTFKDMSIVLPDPMGNKRQIVKFSSLSSTGGLLNVYKALQLAEQLYPSSN